MKVKQQQEALKNSNGVLKEVANFNSDVDIPLSGAPQLNSASVTLRDVTPRTRISSTRQPTSPVSISEAAKLAGQRGSRKRKHIGIRTSKPAVKAESSFQGSLQSRLNICQTSTPITPSLDSGDTIRDQQLQVPVWVDSDESHTEGRSDGIVKVSKVKSRKSSTRRERTEGLGLVGDTPEYPNGLEMDSDAPTGDSHKRNPKSTTPNQKNHDSNSSLLSQRSERGTRPRTQHLNTTAIQDASLPSPSLSPVTAAANLHNRGGYFEGPAFESASDLHSFEPSQEQTEETMNTQSSVEDRPHSARGLASTMTPGGSRKHSAASERPTTPSLMDIPTILDSFEAMPTEMKSYVMYQLLRRCPKKVLHIVASVVNPALKCDFLSLLPIELSLNIVGHLDVKSLCSATQVSRKWRQIIDSDEQAWKNLFDTDGYELPAWELQRAIREGWGWQHASRPDDWERDLSIAGQIPSDTELSAYSTHTALSACGASIDNGDTGTAYKRTKRKAGGKSKPKARKQQKRNHEDTVSFDADAWLESASTAEGPYAAASAAALAVPYARVGLPSLKNLHLFKSIYRRHHVIRQSWMQEQTKPRHLAFRAHQRHVVTCLQFDPDKILTGSDDTNINVYDTQTGALRARLEGHEGGVWALQYEGNVLVSGSTDRSVRVWDIERGICTQVFQGHTSTVRCLQILMPTQVGVGADNKPIMKPKQPLIITGSRDSNLRVWKLPRPGDPGCFQAGPAPDDADCPYFVRVLTGHHHSVRAIAAHADTLVSGSYDSSVRVWKISTGETQYRLQGHTQKVYSVVLDHKRNRCISGSMDNLVKVWSLDTGSLLFNLEGHSSLVGLLDLQGDRLVSAAADSTLRIWDPDNGHCKSTLSAHTGAITCFQHDGQKVISGSDRTLKMWNVTTGGFVKDLLTDLSGVWQVKFNARRCVAAVQRNNLTYIEVCTHQTLYEFKEKLTSCEQVLDFGACRDGVPEHKRGRRIVVNSEGQEVADPHDTTIDLDVED